MHTAARQVLSVACLLAAVGAKDIGYISELDIFSSLAPCAASAINDGFGPETYTTKCGQEETALQKCICSNTAERREVAATVASSVSYSCGSVGTDDQWSASKVIDQYCNPTETITFAKPSADVQAYIMEIPELSNLPKCAQSGIGWALGPVSAKCPEAANLWAPCACSKKGVADEFRSTVSESARSYCSNAEDASSALSFVDAYCNMNKGTTSFGKPSGPPGDMTYYITALSQFHSLRPCAQAGLSSIVQLQTEYFCATGPQALASCVCLKSRFAQGMSASVTSGIKETCSSTASDDVASALEVFEYYCKAAENKVVATVTESISQSYPTAQSRTGSFPSNPASTETGQNNNGHNSSPQKKSKKKVGAAVIAASVLGVLIALGLVIGLIVFIRRKRAKQNTQAAAPSQGEVANTGSYHNELDPTSQTPSSELDAKSPATAVSTLVSPQSATQNTAEISTGVPGYAVHYYNNSPVHEAPSTHGRLGQQQNSYGQSYELDSGVPYHGR